jgi:hypothetical protein
MLNDIIQNIKNNKAKLKKNINLKKKKTKQIQKNFLNQVLSQKPNSLNHVFGFN